MDCTIYVAKTKTLISLFSHMLKAGFVITRLICSKKCQNMIQKSEFINKVLDMNYNSQSIVNAYPQTTSMESSCISRLAMVVLL